MKKITFPFLIKITLLSYLLNLIQAMDSNHMNNMDNNNNNNNNNINMNHIEINSEKTKFLWVNFFQEYNLKTTFPYDLKNELSNNLYDLGVKGWEAFKMEYEMKKAKDKVKNRNKKYNNDNNNNNNNNKNILLIGDEFYKSQIILQEESNNNNNNNNFHSMESKLEEKRRKKSKTINRLYEKEPLYQDLKKIAFLYFRNTIEEFFPMSIVSSSSATTTTTTREEEEEEEEKEKEGKKLTIDQIFCWSTIGGDKDYTLYHPPHSHKNSVLSGVFYTSHDHNNNDDIAPLILMDPRGSGISPFGNTYEHYPQANTFVVFPSWLLHYVGPTNANSINSNNEDNKYRVSFSCNLAGDWETTSDFNIEM